MQQVRALPLGANETLTAEQLLDHDPYEGPTEEVEGELTTIEVPADPDFDLPGYTLYLVDNTPVDPSTIKKLQVTASSYLSLLRDRALEFANPYHDERGRFTTGPGGTGGAVRKNEDPAEIRKWAKENGHEVSDRGRIPESVQKAYRSAMRKAAKAEKPTPAAEEPKSTGAFSDRFHEATKGLDADLKGLVTVEGGFDTARHRPVVTEDIAKIAAVEQRVTAAGRMLHDEITARLKASGIRTEQGAADLRKALWEIRTKQADEFDKFRDTKNPDETSALAQFKKLYPGKRYADATPEQVEAIVSHIDSTHPGYKAAWQALIDTDKKIETTKGDDNAYAVAYRTHALAILSEVRGGNYGNLSFDRVIGGGTRAPSKEVIESFKRAGSVYPDDWVAESNAAGMVTIEAKTRGLHTFKPNSVMYNMMLKGRNGEPDKPGYKRYDQNSAIVTSKDPGLNPAIDSSQYFPTTVHEMGHRFEELRPHIKAMEAAFVHRRTKGEKAQPLRSLRPGERYESNEVAKPDKFLHPYIGKIYENGTTASPYEVFTMGIQGMLGGSSWLHIHNDPDYASFILGLLAKG